MRPKTIKYGSGEITFKNISIEEREEVIKKIKGPEMEAVWDEDTEEWIFVPKTVKVAEPVVKNLPDTGYSFLKVGNQWSAVEVKLNIETKEAEVVNVTSLHSNRNIASERFRVKFGKNWF